MTTSLPQSKTITVLFADPVHSDDPVFNEHRQQLLRWSEDADIDGIRVRLVLPDRGQEELVEEALPGAEVLVVQRGHVGEEMISRGRRLKLIHVIGTEGSTVDLPAARRLGVQVSMVPHYGCVVVAEHSIMLMLALVRKLLPLHARTAAGDNPRGLPTIVTSQWKRHFNWLGLEDSELGSLYGRTLGIIGLGEIGTEVARRARVFGMEVVYNKRSRLHESKEEALGARFAPIDVLLEQSDIVSLHCSHNEQTHKLINAETLAMMKSSAFLVNTARGGIVDLNALEVALDNGTIAGAGLDVFPVEPLPSTSRLTAMPQVVLSPHVAARAPIMGRYADLVENLRRLVRGSTPRGLLTLNAEAHA